MRYGKSQAEVRLQVRMEEKIQFAAIDKKITVYPATTPGSPVIYMNTVTDDGSKEHLALAQMCGRDFTLAVIGNLRWNHDMSPWAIPPVSENDAPCTGGADNYLRLLTSEIVPKAERQIPGPVSWRGLVGYSLAGLFAVYAAYRTDLFSRIGSISGSLWFPDFREFVSANAMKIKPKHLYLSLGDRECQTKNPFLKTVLENTVAIKDFYQRDGIDCVFQLNAGGHFKNVTERTAAGIAWLLTRPHR